MMGTRFSEEFAGEALRLDPGGRLLETSRHRPFHREINPLLRKPATDACRTTNVASHRTHLFLYGTLMRGCCNHQHIDDQDFIGEVSTAPGYRLYALTGYPGMVPDNSDTVGVPGELWKVDADCLARLDRFEGTDLGLYRLASVPLRPPFDRIEALTYLYPHSITGRDAVTGKWREGGK